MKTLLIAIGVAMFLEGTPYLLFPDQAREMMQVISKMSNNTLRLIGGGLVITGFLLLYLL